MLSTSSSILPRFASSRASRTDRPHRAPGRVARSAGPIATLAAALALASACSKDDVGLRGGDEHAGGDFGQEALIEATRALSETPRSPEAYRSYVETIDALRPHFNQRVADAAELRLTVMAVEPLKAWFGKPGSEQMEALATTVWPVALRVEPQDGESPEAYVRRICLEDLALECKHVVPERWPDVLAARVWRDLGDRAREAVQGCDQCSDDSFAKVIDEYDRHEDAMLVAAARAKEEGHPASWPTAPAGGMPWSEPLVLHAPPGGEIRVGGEPASADWRQQLAARRGDADVLGLHLAPEATIDRLRELAGVAKQAGYREVAVVAREPDFPYERREYRLPADPRRVLAGTPLRPTDSVQLLVRHLAR